MVTLAPIVNTSVIASTVLHVMQRVDYVSVWMVSLEVDVKIVSFSLKKNEVIYIN